MMTSGTTGRPKTIAGSASARRFAWQTPPPRSLLHACGRPRQGALCKGRGRGVTLRRSSSLMRRRTAVRRLYGELEPGLKGILEAGGGVDVEDDARPTT